MEDPAVPYIQRLWMKRGHMESCLVGLQPLCPASLTLLAQAGQGGLRWEGGGGGEEPTCTPPIPPLQH